MSFTAIEKAILDLSDAGLSPGQIAKHGYAPNRIRYVLGTFGTKEQDKASTDRNRRRMAASSRDLLDAINQARRA